MIGCIAILFVLAIALLPNTVGGGPVNAFADQANLQRIRDWLTGYRLRFGHLPNESGHKFLLELWVKGICTHDVESFDRFFAPGAREEDPHYLALRKRVQGGDDPWPSLEQVSSADTHYAGRATSGVRNDGEARHAWAADDNENGWTIADGTINILYDDGTVSWLSIERLTEQFQWPGLGKVFPVGPDSPHPDLRTLER
jgi:hypothetical protein